MKRTKDVSYNNRFPTTTTHYDKNKTLNITFQFQIVKLFRFKRFFKTRVRWYSLYVWKTTFSTISQKQHRHEYSYSFIVESYVCNGPMYRSVTIRYGQTERTLSLRFIDLDFRNCNYGCSTPVKYRLDPSRLSFFILGDLFYTKLHMWTLVQGHLFSGHIPPIKKPQDFNISS